MIKEIINLLDNELNFQDQEFQKKKQKLFGTLIELKETIKKIKEDANQITELNLNHLTTNLEIDLENITKLEMYQFFAKTRNFALETAQIEDIKNLFNTFYTKVETKEQEIRNNNPDYEQQETKIEELINLKQKVISNNTLTIQEFKYLVSLIRKNSKDFDKCISLISYLSIKLVNSYDKSGKLTKQETTQKEKPKEITDVAITNLSLEELTNLFLKYDYNFQDFNEKSKKLLLQYGDLSNIENILKVLKEKQIKVNISEAKQKFATVLTLSNQEIVLTIINNIKDDLENNSHLEYKLNEMFFEYLNHPSMFINGYKRYSLEPKMNNDSNDSHLINGSYQNYLLNRELFISLGLKDINGAIKKCGSAFLLSHQRVKNSLTAFDLYGINKQIYLDTLTCMSAINPLDEIDKYIEIGCYDYIANNFSMVAFPRKNEEIYYKIKNARNLGYTNDQIYRFIKNGDIKKVVLRKSSLLDKMNGKSLDGEMEYHSELENDYNNLDFSIFEPIDERVLNNYFIKHLENNFKCDDLTYDFNGIIISRYKVLRIYAILLKNRMAGNLNSLMYSIIRGSLLTKSEYDMIGDCLNRVYASGGLSL